MLQNQHLLGRPIRKIRIVPFIHPISMPLLKYTIGHEKRCIESLARVPELQNVFRKFQNSQQAPGLNHIVSSEYVSRTEKVASFFD